MPQEVADGVIKHSFTGSLIIDSLIHQDRSSTLFGKCHRKLQSVSLICPEEEVHHLQPENVVLASNQVRNPA